jgi:hypothetical protein
MPELNGYERTDAEAALLLEGAEGFAGEMVKVYRHGRLSDRQRYWLHRLASQEVVRRAVTPAPSREVPVALETLARLMNLAAARLQKPKITFALPEGALRISFANARIARQGSLFVSSPDYSIRYGVVSPAGRAFAPAPNCPDWVLACLNAFSNDPAGFAARYGRLTGRCCFCDHPLVTEESVSVGYGPVCASHMELPWGAAAARAAAAAV